MLEKPDISDERILHALRTDFGLDAQHLGFLPLGADMNTAVYRARAGGAEYFVKLRSGAFSEISVAVPALLSQQGIAEIIAPLRTQTGSLYASLENYALVLYPYIQGDDGYTTGLSAEQWVRFGAALRRVHSAEVPPTLSAILPVETFSARWREVVEAFQGMVEEREFLDPAAARLAEQMIFHRAEIRRANERAIALARELEARSLPRVLCHTDLHAGNLHIAGPNDFFIVDWDAPLLAPKERDLMYPGSGLSGKSTRPDEIDLFFQGYGPVHIDPVALAYYRFERIIEDFAAYGEQLLLSDEGGSDREQSLVYFESIFEPGGVLEMAWKSDV